MTAAAVGPARLLTLVGGFLLWHLALLVLYALFSIGCDAGWQGVEAGPISLQRLLLLGVWVLHLAALGLFLWFVHRLRRGDRDRGHAYRFVGGVALGLAAWALLGAVALGLPLFGVTACL